MAKKRRRSDRCEPLRMQLDNIDGEISDTLEALADPIGSAAQKAGLRRLLARQRAMKTQVERILKQCEAMGSLRLK
jgi:hypothetical protein